MDDEYFYPKSRKEWRDWLKKHHLKKDKITIIHYKKHTKKPSISHRESLEEAICFGWIDTTAKGLDEERYTRRFCKRNNKSRWSSATLSYAKKLLDEKKMSPFGIKMYEEGLQKPTIDFNLEKNPDPPGDLLRALKKDKFAEKNFLVLAPSYKRYYIRWILSAKLPETRKRRIAEVVVRIREKKKPGMN